MRSFWPIGQVQWNAKVAFRNPRISLPYADKNLIRIVCERRKKVVELAEAVEVEEGVRKGLLKVINDPTQAMLYEIDPCNDDK